MRELPSDDPSFRYPLDAPEENLEIEFKRELDLRTPEGKAKLAQEVCALCNVGGGWLVLGRNDDGSYPDDLPPSIKNIDQDTVNQAVSAYLAPAPHCTVRHVRPNGFNFEVVVIRVPSVGAIPICGKKNGPEDNMKRTVGVRKGVHYARKAGPVSAQIESPDEWQDVIRRCTLSDRSTLLSALSTMLSRPQLSQGQTSELDPQFEDLLAKWANPVIAP